VLRSPLGHRDAHSFRRTFVTLARTDGAPVDLVERVTHNAKGAQIDGYTYFGWEALCSAVSVLKLGAAYVADASARRAAEGVVAGFTDRAAPGTEARAVSVEPRVAHVAAQRAAASVAAGAAARDVAGTAGVVMGRATNGAAPSWASASMGGAEPGVVGRAMGAAAQAAANSAASTATGAATRPAMRAVAQAAANPEAQCAASTADSAVQPAAGASTGRGAQVRGNGAAGPGEGLRGRRGRTEGGRVKHAPWHATPGGLPNYAKSQENLVESRGIEPLTFSMPSRRSPN
jgi:hypothetical protein